MLNGNELVDTLAAFLDALGRRMTGAACIHICVSLTVTFSFVNGTNRVASGITGPPIHHQTG